MPASKTEQMLQAIEALLGAVTGAEVERNSAVPEKIPVGGLIVLRDGDPGLQQIGAALEADVTLGGLAFGLTYDRPEPVIEAVHGAPVIKSATLTVTVDYPDQSAGA